MTTPTTQLIPKGITRHTPALGNNTGEADELINLRVKNGALRTVGSKVLRQRLDLQHNDDMPQYIVSKVYYHTDRYLFLNSFTNKLHHYIDSDHQAEIHDFGDETVGIFYNLGNVLVVQTDTSKYFFIWDADTSTYTTLPAIPKLDDIECSDNATGSYFTTTNRLGAGTAEDDFKLCYADLLVKLAELKKTGKIEGHILFRLAYKLYDGTYIMHSPTIYAHAGYYHSSVGTTQYHYVSGTYSQFVLITVSNIGLTLRMTGAELSAIQDYQKYGIIQGISLFMTPPISNYKLSPDFSTWTNIGSGMYYSELSDLENLGKSPVFYKVGDVTAINSTAINFDSLISEAFIDIDNITSKATLQPDDFTHHTITCESVNTINSRLHMCNINTKLSESMRLYLLNEDLIQGDFTTTPPVGLELWQETSIVANNKTYKILQQLDTGICYNNVLKSVDYVAIDGFLSYPDARATKIRFLIYDGTNWHKTKVYDQFNTPAYVEYFDLEANEFHNYAFYMNKWLYTDNVNEYGNRVVCPIGIVIDTFVDSEVTDVEPDAVVTYPDTNRLQLSGVENPFINPAINSYRVGGKENILVSAISNAELVSEGQFGQFPLYLFTGNDGIFIAEPGQDLVVYKSIISISSENCVNAASGIMRINGGIVFTTENFLKIIIGREVLDISAELRESMATGTFIKADNQFVNACSSDKISNVISAMNTDSVLDMVNFAGIGLSYDAINNEILVLSAEFYVLTYCLNSKMWYRRTDIYDGSIRVGSSLAPYTILNVDGDSTVWVYYPYKEDNTVYMPCLYVSRPALLEISGYKIMERAVLRLFAHQNWGNFTAVYAYVSLDGITWILAGAIQHPMEDISDVVLRRSAFSFKYIVFVVAGTWLAEDSYMGSINVAVKPKFGNKLR